MATPRDLTERQRLAQIAVGALVVRQMRTVWSTLDPGDLDGTFDDWVTQVLGIVNNGRALSERVATNYLAAFRVVNVGSTFDPVLAGGVDPAALSTSMLVTGPVSIRANLARMGLDRAVKVAEERTASAAMRHSLNAGRETITQTIKADPRAVGYERVTSGNACEFCSMLAGRGAVYGAESADFEAHDRCTCSAEPVYR